MFWGLIMEPGRCYTQTVKVSFHVSMAALDISNSNDDPAQVMCVFEGRNYLLCTLKKKDMIQCPLDLNFEAGTKVSFATNGKAHVHLTGYLTNFEDDILEEAEEEEDSKPISNKEKKRAKKAIAEGPPSKKTKTNSLASANTEEVEEEESDSDFDVDKLMQADDDEDIEEEESGEEEGAEEEEDDEEGEEEASSLSEDEVSEEEKIVKPKQNGLAKSQTKKSKEQKVSEKVPKEKPQKQEKKQKPKKTVLKGGVIIEELREGNGELAKEGKFVHVYYEGRLKENNKMFDSTTKGPGFSFRVGKGEVIKGWDIGLVGMKVGGKRRIICPPKVAYGAQGSPPVIPPNSTLVFDVELKKVS